MYRCLWCGSVFERPATRSYSENLDGERGVWKATVLCCPWCKSDDIEEVDANDEGENCNG